MGLIPLGILSSATIVFPSFIPDLVARYDAADLSSISLSGSDVTQWSDVSGNARHATQSTSTFRPKSGTRTINGLNAIDFDGTDDRLNANSVAASFTGNDRPFTIFMVQAKDIANSSLSAFVFDSGLTTVPFMRYRGENILMRDDANTQTELNVDGIDAATPMFVTFRSSGLNFTGYLNKTLVNTGTAYNRGNITVERFRIGQFTTASPLFYNGLIGEFIYYNRQLTALEVGQVHDYLSAKWGI